MSGVADEASYRTPAPVPGVVRRFRPGVRAPAWRYASWAIVAVACAMGFGVHLVSRNASVDCTSSGTTLRCRVAESDLGRGPGVRTVEVANATHAVAVRAPRGDAWVVSVRGAGGETPLTHVGTGNQGDAAWVAAEIDRLLTGKIARAQSGYTYTGLAQLLVVLAAALSLLGVATAWELSRRAALEIDPARAQLRIAPSCTRRREESVAVDQIRGFTVERRGAGARIVIETAAGAGVPLTDAFYLGGRRQRRIAAELAALLVTHTGSEVAPPSAASPRRLRALLVDAAALAVGIVFMAPLWAAEMLPRDENTGWVLQLAWTVPATVVIVGIAGFVFFKLSRHAAHKSFVGYVAMYTLLVSPLAGWRAIRLLNVGLDRSPAVSHASRFVRHIRRSKGPDKIEIADWTDPDATLTLEASWVPFSDQIAGRALRVEAHPGWLGVEWVSAVKVGE